MSVLKKGALDASNYPTKRTVNLAKRESHKQSLTTIVCGVAIIAVVCGLIVKFGVVDQFGRLSEAEQAYSDVHMQYMEMQDALTDYDEVEQEYHTYSRNWMTEDENALGVTVDRMEVLDLLESQLMSSGTVKSLTVEGDTVVASMSGTNLEGVSAMFERLQQQKIVKNAKLTIASTTSDTNSALDFSVTITLQSEDEADADSDSSAQSEDTDESTDAAQSE
jgi:Tfp pilus assembly protein PilN